MLFKERKYLQAESLFREIIEREKKTKNCPPINVGYKGPKGAKQTGAQVVKKDAAASEIYRNLIDAINSICYCIKFRTTFLDLLEDNEIDILSGKPEELDQVLSSNESSGTARVKAPAFSYLCQLYEEALKLDPDDVEANFNIGGLYM